jgi:ADP-heptose:LPS heptosyltransferase
MSSRKWSLVSKKFWDETFRVIDGIKLRDQVALDFQGLVKSGLFAYLSRAKTRIGFHKKNLREPSASFFYTEHLDPISEKIHVICKNLKLLTRIGIKEDGFEFPLEIPEKTTESILERIKPSGYSIDNPFVLLNVGAAWETKRWFAERWIDLINKLRAKKKNLFLLLLWGTEEEKNLAQKIQAATGTPITSSLSIKEVMALVRLTDLLVSGDTFALQAACAFSRPVVGIFGPTNPQRNGPFSRLDGVAFHELDCSHCYKRKCPSLECMKIITPDEVARLSFQILENNG